jgi:tetratricopeptide (TPR) repeat protein
MFWSRPYDRARALAIAEKARSRGRLRKAVRWYLKVLAQDPGDLQTNAKVAPLLARLRRWTEAQQRFDAAASGFLAAGFSAKAIAVWTVAAHTFPEAVEYRERIADQLVMAGRRQDAILSLLEGRSHLRKRRQRPLAILLLQQVYTLDPGHVSATLDLADLLRREGSRSEARRLLANILAHARVRDLRRRVRFALFRLEPSWRGAVDWALAR